MKRLCQFGILLCAYAFLSRVPTAHAQQLFAFPAYGGSVGYSFNSTNAAAPGKYHTGIDCWGPSYGSTYIQASTVGTVHSITINGQNDHGMGNCVILRHNVIVSSNGATSPYYTLYAHLDGIVNGLKAGQAVKRLQIIGTMGSTGQGQRYYWGKTPHLHFEVKTGGVLHNPGGGGTYWGYTPKDATQYGYINPAVVLGNWSAK